MPDIITIDGPASAGKNTLSELFSQKIGYHYIDSGYFYRAGCIYIIDNKLDPQNEQHCEEAFRKLNVEIKEVNGETRFYAYDQDVTDRLHAPEVSNIVPIVAAKPIVRLLLKDVQHKLVQENNTVMSGRDIGSEIFPLAKLKFIITASPEERAQRRLKQLQAKNHQVTFEEVLEQVKQRDLQDTTRDVSPYRIPDDAVVIDTTGQEVQESLQEMVKQYEKKYHSP